MIALSKLQRMRGISLARVPGWISTRASAWARVGLGSAAAFLFGMLAGCAYRPVPVAYDPGYAQSVTSDGLYRTIDRRLATTLVKPGARFDLYDAFVIDPVTLSYENPPGKETGYNLKQGNFELGPGLTERMKRILRESLEHGITESGRYAVAAQAGPATLRLTPHIVDFVYSVPPPQHSTEDRIVLQTGAMTLVLEIFDSETGTRLALMAERKSIKPTSSSTGGYNASAVRTWTGVRDVSYAWSLKLAGELRDYYDHAPLPAAPPTGSVPAAQQP